MLKLKPLLIVFSCCRPDRLRAYVDDIEIKAAHTVGEDQDLDTQIQVPFKAKSTLKFLEIWKSSC